MKLKWLFDRTVSLAGLLLLWPVMAVVAILIKIRMPGGPVFFVQDRVGRGGRLFKFHKFRTMTMAHHGSSVTVAGDSRITPLGAKLRHTKLDELPSLWDVFRGKMSFVGPRPDVPGYADKLTGDDRDVLKLRPGITGPATLKYRLEDEMIAEYVAARRADGDPREPQEIAIEYNDTVIFPDKVRLNCYYCRHYSFVKDIQMILCTVLGKHMKYDKEII
jgi:lipopolysaccharide/colanic/teichoic acid biosynthesis glycosyltransferase